MKKFLSILSILIIVLAGCGNQTPASPSISENENKLQVYTTVYPLLYFIQFIGGEFVNAQSIYPNGADEHTYEPTQKEMINIAEADLFFYIGQGLEGFVDKALETLRNEKVTFVATAEHLSLDKHDEHDHEATEEHNHDDHETTEEHNHDDHDHETTEEHNHGDFDPHVWLDPTLSIELAKEISEALVTQLPEHQAYFEANYEKLKVELESLDHEFSTTIDAFKNKKFIVTHAAYGYWEKRYGLEQISISGIDSSSEPSQKKLQQIIETAQQLNTPYVFIEQNTSSKLSDTVINEIDGESLLLHNLSVLTDQDVQNKETYFTLMRNNLASLTKALQ